MLKHQVNQLKIFIVDKVFQIKIVCVYSSYCKHGGIINIIVLLNKLH